MEPRQMDGIRRDRRSAGPSLEARTCTNAFFRYDGQIRRRPGLALASGSFSGSLFRSVLAYPGVGDNEYVVAATGSTVSGLNSDDLSGPADYDTQFPTDAPLRQLRTVGTAPPLGPFDTVFPYPTLPWTKPSPPRAGPWEITAATLDPWMTEGDYGEINVEIEDGQGSPAWDAIGHALIVQFKYKGTVADVSINRILKTAADTVGLSVEVSTLPPGFTIDNETDEGETVTMKCRVLNVNSLEWETDAATATSEVPTIQEAATVTAGCTGVSNKEKLVELQEQSGTGQTKVVFVSVKDSGGNALPHRLEDDGSLSVSVYLTQTEDDTTYDDVEIVFDVKDQQDNLFERFTVERDFGTGCRDGDFMNGKDTFVVLTESNDSNFWFAGFIMKDGLENELSRAYMDGFSGHAISDTNYIVSYGHHTMPDYDLDGENESLAQLDPDYFYDQGDQFPIIIEVWGMLKDGATNGGGWGTAIVHGAAINAISSYPGDVDDQAKTVGVGDSSIGEKDALTYGTKIFTWRVYSDGEATVEG